MDNESYANYGVLKKFYPFLRMLDFKIIYKTFQKPITGSRSLSMQ